MWLSDSFHLKFVCCHFNSGEDALRLFDKNSQRKCKFSRNPKDKSTDGKRASDINKQPNSRLRQFRPLNHWTSNKVILLYSFNFWYVLKYLTYSHIKTIKPFSSFEHKSWRLTITGDKLHNNTHAKNSIAAFRTETFAFCIWATRIFENDFSE